MAKQKHSAGRINRKRVGYVESPADAHVMLEWARNHSCSRSSKPMDLRVVISEEIAPFDAPEIVAILKIGGYKSRSVDQLFTMAVAESPWEKDLAMAVLNPRVLFFKEKALKKLNDKYQKAYISREAARLRLEGIHIELHRVETELRATNSRIFELQRNIRSTLIIRAAAKPPPLHLPRSITPDELRQDHSFLLDPLFLEANPPMLKPAAAIAEGILQLRISLGLPPAGDQTSVAKLLTKLRAELAILIRRLVTLEMDKSVLLQDADMEETAISALNDMLPQLMALMRNRSVYGAEGLNEEGGTVAGDLGDVAVVAAGAGGVVACSPVPDAGLAAS